MTAADWISDRRALLDAATEGPWERDTHYGYKVVVAPPEGWRQTVGHVAPPDVGRPPKLRGVIESCNAANGDFIADARTSLPKALDALADVLRRHTPHTETDCGGLWSECFITFSGKCANVGRCRICRDAFPCLTVQGIATALGVESC